MASEGGRERPLMPTHDVLIIGAGQAGLAMGYHLAQRDVDFLILDGSPRIGDVWRNRYDSLVLFSASQYNHLPGMPFPKAPDTYPTKDEVAEYLETYASVFGLPVRLDSPVTALSPTPDGYRVETPTETYLAAQVVIATGPFQTPFVPPFAQNLDPSVFQIHSSQYRNPDQLPPGDVLVVGAGNSGAQIAEELARTRKVHLAIGRKQPQLPQEFLGKTIFWWLKAMGAFEVTVDSPAGRWLRARDPLFGTDLRKLQRDCGVERMPRVTHADAETVHFADGRTLSVPAIVWATGFRSEYPWVKVPVFDANGQPQHLRGVSSSPGLYFLGLPWQVRRGSALLLDVGRDAASLAEQIVATRA
ncbi:putative oxidoreductase CzcO [compost metagenome]